MKSKFLIKMFAVVTAMMCALGMQAAEAYANYTPSNTTLTFYYDNQRASRTGTTYDMNTLGHIPDWISDTINYKVTAVVFDPSFAGATPTVTHFWFFEMQDLKSITGLSYLNTSQVTNMSNMFYNCVDLTTLDLSTFNTANVTEMNHMFKSCKGLKSLDLTSFSTAKVTRMDNMFYDCTGLTTLDLSSFNTAKVTRMDNMFMYCTRLTTIYVGSYWNTEAVVNSDGMFINCVNLVGGMGTTYDANYLDKTYAHIDGGPSNPGYFTDSNGPRPYACYHAGYSTLTFYYDNQKSSRPGEIFDLNEGSENPDWYDNGWSYEVTKVVFDPSFADARPTTTVNWFAEMYELTSVEGIENLNTSEVTDMGGMFWECGSLPYVDVSGFDTHNVTNMNSMFAECYELTGLDVSGFDTRNVTSMESMFGNCSELTFLDVSGFNTAKVTSMYNLFGGCGLTSLDLRSFDTHNVTNMCYMFSSCSELKTIYVGEGWTTAGVTVSDEMFYYCLSIVGGQGTTYDPSNPKDKTYAHIDGGPSNPGYFTEFKEAYACYTSDNTTLTFYYDNLRSSRTGTTYDLNTGGNTPGWYTDGTNENVTKVVFKSSFANARPTSTFRWFARMSNLATITGLNYLNTTEVTSMYAMFLGCSSLTSLDLSSFNTANVKNMADMFYNCSSLGNISVGNGWSTASVANSGWMFSNCTNLIGGLGTKYDSAHIDKDYAHIDGGSCNPGYFIAEGSGPWDGTEVYACYTPSNTTLTFYCDKLRSTRSGTTYDLNTGNYYPKWENDGSNANVTRVVFDPSFANVRPTTTVCWFYEMHNLQSITGISYLNTTEVTKMSGMFHGCNSLRSLDVSHFNTVNVTYMWRMFYDCSSLTSLDLSNFNTVSVISMYSMFQDCSSLVSLDLSNFNTANVESMGEMFSGCTALTSLDLSSFRTTKVTDMENMFDGSSNLRTIYVGNGWSTASVTNSTSMFYGCTSLVGGQGTTYNASNPMDKTYANIDGGPSNPGYFTEKPAFLRGDVNGDGSVNIADVTSLIDYLLSGNASDVNVSAADCNQDSSVNISDVTSLIDYLLSGSW